MFFSDPDQIPELAQKTGCAIFVVPDNTKINLKNALFLEPNEKGHISIDQVREITALLNTKQTSDRFLIIRPADAMNESASNAFLKNLEEPKENYHFILITESPYKLLPTILSRSQIFFLKIANPLEADLSASKDIREIAKKFIAAKPADLPALAEQVAKKKDNARLYALEILATAIEILYKSYFKTNNEVLVHKISPFLKAYENISQNGHLKLHLVADLMV